MTIRLRIAGGNRRGSFEQSLAGLEEEIELVAVCDPSDEVLRGWIEKRSELEAFSNFEDLIENPNMFFPPGITSGFGFGYSQSAIR